MKRTNSKEVELKIYNYLKEELSILDEDNQTVESGLYYAINYFNDNNKYDYIGEKNIIQFLRNSCTLFPIYYSDMRDLLKEWLEETEEESQKYSDDKVENLFDNLLERILMKYFKLHKTFKYDFRGIKNSKAYLVYELN